MKLFILKFTSADSYFSRPEYPLKKVFASKEAAVRYYEDHKHLQHNEGGTAGYGLGIDWEIEEWEAWA